MNKILGTGINIKFLKLKLGLEIKCNVQRIQIKYKTYVSYKHNINVLFI